MSPTEKKPIKKTAKRGRPKQTKDGQSNRTLILESALKEFALHGFEGAKISDIAKRAGVVTPAVNYHFKSKEDLWKSSMEYSFDVLLKNSNLSLDGALQDLDDLSFLRVLVRQFIRYTMHHPEHPRIILLEGMRDTSRSKWLIEKFIYPLHDNYKELFSRLQDKGIIKPFLEPELTLFSMMTGAVLALETNISMVGDLYDIDQEDENFWIEQENSMVNILFNGILTSPE